MLLPIVALLALCVAAIAAQFAADVKRVGRTALLAEIVHNWD